MQYIQKREEINSFMENNEKENLKKIWIRKQEITF